MRQGGGKSKGAAFERDVCKKLSKWLSNGERDDLLWRSAMSGGRATLMLKKGSQAASQSGDLSSIDALSHHFIEQFSIECKTYKDLHLHTLVYGGNQGIVKFWGQALEDAVNHNKRPILIAKQNFKPELIGMEKSTAIRGRISPESILVSCHRLNLHVMFLDTFLKEVRPERYQP